MVNLLVRSTPRQVIQYLENQKPTSLFRKWNRGFVYIFGTHSFREGQESKQTNNTTEQVELKTEKPAQETLKKLGSSLIC